VDCELTIICAYVETVHHHLGNQAGRF
jgi:hypothetical protein